MSSDSIAAQRGRRPLLGKIALPVFMVIALQHSIHADQNPTAALGEHLREMKQHMVQMHEMLGIGTGCSELDRHMQQMTLHMEMMMDMMEKMHKDKPDHVMNYE